MVWMESSKRAAEGGGTMKLKIRAATMVLVLFQCAALSAAGREATIYMIDGTKLKATVDLETFSLRTPYGQLDVPTKDIEAVFPGFRSGEATHKRIADMIVRLKGKTRAQASADLVNMGRIAVPQLQDVVANSADKEIVAEAKNVLKKVWPTGAKVPSDGLGIVIAGGMELRGMVLFQKVRLEGDFGKKTIETPGIRLIHFGADKAPTATDPADYPTTRGGAKPEFELIMKDDSHIIGTLDAPSVNVETAWGKLQVPTKEIISIRLGEPDEFVTRGMTFKGKFQAATIEVASKVGDFTLDREKVDKVAAVPEKGTIAVAEGDKIKPNEWCRIFNGKDLTGWSKWGDGDATCEGGDLHLTKSEGLTYTNMDDVSDVIMGAQVRIDKVLGGGGGVKLVVRECADGDYFVHFDGTNGTVCKWDNKTKQPTQLKTFQAPPAQDGWHTFQFGVLGTTMLAYINGQPVADIKLDPKDSLGPGKVSLGVWNCDAVFRDVKIKVLK
jgi:hypothetical protein